MNITSILKSNIRQYAMLIALVIIIIYFQIATKGVLLVPQNVTNLVLQNGYVFILAIGMTLCILTGGNIDLSVGSVAAFIGAVSGTLIITMKMPIAPAILISLAAGAVIGAWQGFWIAYVRIPPFIVTLAGMLIFRGLTLSILKGLTLAPFPPAYVKISAGFIPDILGGGAAYNLTAYAAGGLLIALYAAMQARGRLSKKKLGIDVSGAGLFIGQLAVVSVAIALFTHSLARYKGIPILLIIIGALILLYSFFTTQTVMGRHIYAVGGNEKAAKCSGIDTNRILFGVYLNMAVLAAVAGVVFSSRINSASPQAGTNFELDAIAACFIGGASATGGIGTVVGAIVGAAVMGVLNNGMSIMGVESYVQMTVKGLVLLAAVAFDIVSKNMRKS